MASGITLNGERFKKDLERVNIGNRRSVLVKAGLEAVEPLRLAAGRNAPVDTGALSRDIQKQEDTKLSDAETVTIEVASSGKTFYGSFQEWGTAHHPPQPFMQPAIDETVDDVEAGLATALNNAIQSQLTG